MSYKKIEKLTSLGTKFQKDWINFNLLDYFGPNEANVSRFTNSLYSV